MSRWFTWYARRPQATVTLVCLPHAGGGANAYQRWPDTLPAWFDLAAVQYPGRQSRFGEPLVENMSELADDVAKAVADIDGPVALFGHSMGALVGYEVARRLPDVPVRLFVSGARAPHHRRRNGEHRLDDDGLIEYVVGLGGQGAEALRHPEIRELAVPVVRGDLTLLAEYEPAPGPPLSCPVTVLVGAEDQGATATDGERWRETTIGDFDLAVLPGGHFFPETERTGVVSLVADRLGSKDGC